MRETFFITAAAVFLGTHRKSIYRIYLLSFDTKLLSGSQNQIQNLETKCVRFTILFFNS